VEVRLKVAAVLDARAGSLARVYAPLSFVLDVEAYKEGYAAPARASSTAATLSLTSTFSVRPPRDP